MVDLIQPKWPIEPVVQFIVYYYPTNQSNETPTVTNNMLKTYDQALEYSKQIILDNENSGVCVISQMAGTIVFPAINYEDF
jgi:myo-inositol catabolism protein IolC